MDSNMQPLVNHQLSRMSRDDSFDVQKTCLGAVPSDSHTVPVPVWIRAGSRVPLTNPGWTSHLPG